MSKEKLYKCRIVQKIDFRDLFGRRSSLKNRKRVICEKIPNLATNISHKSIEIAWFTSVYAIGTSIGGLITLSRSFWCIIASQTTTDSYVMAENPDRIHFKLSRRPRTPAQAGWVNRFAKRMPKLQNTSTTFLDGFNGNFT